jgi:hypothetical protein
VAVEYDSVLLIIINASVYRHRNEDFWRASK